MWNVLGAFLAFVGGTLVCVLNYYLSKSVLIKKPNSLAIVSILRQFINIAYIVGAYFLAPVTTFDTTFFVIGAAVGATLPSLFFTHRLLTLSKNIEYKKTKDNSDTSTTKEDLNGSK